MIKWFLGCSLLVSIFLNIVFAVALTDQTKVESVDVQFSQQFSQQYSQQFSQQAQSLSEPNKLTLIEIEPLNLAVEKKQENQMLFEQDQLTQLIDQFNQFSDQSDWQNMLDTQQALFELVLNENDELLSKKVTSLIHANWLSQLTLNQKSNLNESWIDAMLQYIDRQPNDLAVGYVYVTYLIDDGQFDEAVSYVNYLKQVSTNNIDLEQITHAFNQLVIDQLNELKAQTNYTQALSLLNAVLQYEVLNVPFLIQKTDLQILLGDFLSAEQTLSMYEFESEYQNQVEQLKLRIANAPKDHSIALKSYGGQFIVNTIFDDGYQENTIALLIDTGASISVINEQIFLQFVDSPNIRFRQNISVDTAGGKVIAKLYDIERIKIGEFEVLQTQFMVLPMAIDKQYQGLLGMSFLRMFDFNIDQKTARLHLKVL
ncbi:retropepsin-like aspartic protease family protein [Marinicellulosiphila megalodicopiae]|uniref:retropepsin-like aspartic protease family protein n=1 Tax=Marinicellulosiphila megalodicopiae TaxID=2724896 RepID=UPI003BB1D902